MTVRTALLDQTVGQAMSSLSAVAKRGLGDPALAELVVIRASQLNHCAFCLDMHLTLAREYGVSEKQLGLLAAWEEAGGVFDDVRLAHLIGLIVAINNWNRVMVGRGVPPGGYTP